MNSMMTNTQMNNTYSFRRADRLLSSGGSRKGALSAAKALWWLFCAGFAACKTQQQMTIKSITNLTASVANKTEHRYTYGNIVKASIAVVPIAILGHVTTERLVLCLDGRHEALNVSGIRMTLLDKAISKLQKLLYLFSCLLCNKRVTVQFLRRTSCNSQPKLYFWKHSPWRWCERHSVVGDC